MLANDQDFLNKSETVIARNTSNPGGVGVGVPT